MAALFLLGASGRITAANESARQLWQAAESELVREPFASLFFFEVVSQEPDWLEAQWEVLLAAALGHTVALQAQPREGAPRDVRVRLEKALPEGTGYFASVEPFAPAATAPAHAHVDERSAALALVVERGVAGFFDLHFQANRIFYSAGWKKLLGYVDAELPNTYETWTRLIHPDDSAAAPDKIGKKNSPGLRPFVAEFRMRHRNGHEVWIQSTGLQLVSEAGHLERVVGLHLDITERKELEEASLANDERLQALSDGGPLAAFELDFLGNRFWFAPAWKRLLGYREEELLDNADTFLAALPPAEAEAGVAAFFLGRATGQSAFVEVVQLRQKDGSPITVLLGVHRQLTRKRELARVTGFACALPDSLSRGEEVVDENVPSRELLATAFATLAEGVLITNDRGQVLHLNAVAARLMRISPEAARGQAVGDIFRLVNRQSGRPGNDPIDRALSDDGAGALVSDDALEVIGGTGQTHPPLPIVWTARAAHDRGGRPLGVVIVFRDPEEMRLTPDELVKANRFESLGLLAGGIAHDFNNLLTSILGGVSIAKDNREYSALGDAESACLTAKGLTKQLLTFAKGGSSPHSIVSPKEILQDAVKIAGAGSSAVITVEVAPGTEPVAVDRAQILQVFQNLLVNALQAMPPPPHPARVQLSAGNLTLAAEQVPSLPAGNYVQFEVRDNGAGIKPEHFEKIWDPFFTTKKHGTGLGLATVLSIVRKHGGIIGVDSTEGVGTVFTAFLPVADRPVDVQARKAPSLRFGTGRVLLMDDDPQVGAMTGTMLLSLDYKYDLAKNGEEAIAFYKRYLNIGRPYDAVIVDLTVIGGMGGEECFYALRELDPDVRVIISSGYDDEDMARQFLEQGFCGYLTKPYRVMDLGKMLKAVLG